MLTSKTASGVAVEVEPVGREYCGMPVAELTLRFVHPTHGRCAAVVKSYSDGRGAAGAVGYGFVGLKTEETTSGKYERSMCVTIPRADFDAGMAEAKALADAAVAELEAADDRRKADARTACPAGYVACRQSWSNGDLCSAGYVTGGGVEVVASDLLESHGGFYWIKAADVEAAVAKAAAAKARETESEAARGAAVAEAVRRSRETGKPVEVARWTEECDGSADDCSTDLCRRVVMPDGLFKVTRTHTH